MEDNARKPCPKAEAEPVCLIYITRTDPARLAATNGGTQCLSDEMMDAVLKSKPMLVQRRGFTALLFT
jgi:hypothetical protein